MSLTDTQLLVASTGAALDRTRQDAMLAQYAVADAAKAHLAAMVRDVFPQAHALIVRFVDPNADALHAGGFDRVSVANDVEVHLQAILAPNPASRLSDLVLFDADEPHRAPAGYRSVVEQDWPEVVAILEQLVLEIAVITGIRQWTWCTDDGSHRALRLAPPNPTVAGEVPR